MSVPIPTSDGRLLDLLRAAGPMAVAELAREVDVTPTAIRQRLIRLMAQGLVQREAVRNGRGRPKHLYRLTDKGLRLTGSNFADLALALWREIGLSGSEQFRQEMIRRVARTLASEYAGQVQGTTLAERMRSLGELLAQRRIPVSVKDFAHQLVMTAHACPYPKLAEQDRRICAMEEMLYAELLGQPVELTQCRLDGGEECCFLGKKTADQRTDQAVADALRSGAAADA